MHSNIIYGAPEGQDARILANMARSLMPEDRVLMHIAMDDSRISVLEELLAFFAPDVKIITLPAWDCLPYDRVSPHGDIVAARVCALTKLMEWDNMRERAPRILLTSVNAALQRVMPREALREASFIAKIGAQINIDKLQIFLSQNGYVRSDTVREAGDFAVRGGIIDIFAAGHENPVRLDLFGDEVESIKIFDPISQRTQGKINEFSLRPATEFFMDDDSISRFRSSYREAFGVVQKDDPLYEAVSAGRRYNGVEHWLPLFYEQMDSVFDYAPNASVTLDFHVHEAYKERVSQVKDFYDSRKILENAANKKASISGAIYHPIPINSLYIDDKEWSELTSRAPSLSAFGSPDSINDDIAKKGRDFSDIRALPDGNVFAELKKYIASISSSLRPSPSFPRRRESVSVNQIDSRLRGNDGGERGNDGNGKTIIAAYSNGSKTRLKGLMENANINDIIDIDDYGDIKKLKPHQIGICVLSLENGFIAPDITVITEQDILGDRLARRAKKSRKADNFLKEVSALNEGDLVVHIDHGVGRFLELETIEAGGVINDCLKIEYAGGDRLFIPVVNLDVLSRFGSDSDTVQLDKLGGANWQARKAKAKKNLMEIADKLLGIAAARQLKKADQLHISQELYDEFVARFPYAETEDQQRSIDSVLKGMAGSYPMDHLVCGDVGFGKTEVALRAAYVAAMSGVQVAVVVPTTLLARQHYNNFQNRFAGSGIRIEQLSRMVTVKDATRTKQGLADGSVQIVIGTHALFADSMKFDNLGLLIVDEEQRFGVKQKEKLKALKSNIHVLTLTATPIPRTLQMSLTGVKEMSLITTPPVDRLAIRTFVMPVDTVVIRDALLREHYRGGQSFYVVPRIKDIKDVSDMLKDLVPEIKFIEAHGQLTPTELEDRMTAFYDRQYDVLLATNIIESGIDIPSANTMVVHRADMFGLSQLYQIRGRIGRSKVRSYAYLTYQPNVKLNPQAQKRLEVMETLDTLGSGFQLASHDMDIRGAGNLLGDAQSGHIREVGVELYQQMLEEAVAAARAGVTTIEDMPEEQWSPQINIGASVLIPESYVPDLGVRMSLYRRLNDLCSAPPSSHWHAEGVSTNGIQQTCAAELRPNRSPQSNTTTQSAGMTDVECDIEGFAAEMIDRFGALPKEVDNLIDILAIKQLCKKAGVSHIDAGSKGAIIAFHKNVPPNIDALFAWIGKKAGSVKIRPDQKLSAIRGWSKTEQRIKGVHALMKELAEL